MLMTYLKVCDYAEECRIQCVARLPHICDRLQNDCYSPACDREMTRKCVSYRPIWKWIKKMFKALKQVLFKNGK